MRDTAMRSMDMKHTYTFLALLMACGGGAPATQQQQTSTGSEESPVTASGEVVVEEAEKTYQAALEAFNAADAANPLRWPEGLCNDIAGKFMDANSKQNNRFTEAIYMAGAARSRCGQTSQARELYTRALQTSDKFCKARVALAVENIDAGRLDAAKPEVERALRDDQNCPEGYTALAMIQRKNPAQRAEALENLRRALVYDARYLPAFNQIALLLLDEATEHGNTTETETAPAATPAAAPAATADIVSAQPGQAISVGLSGDPRALDLGQVVCKQAVLINANYAPIYNTWGLIMVRRGEIFEALRMFEKATTLDADFYEAYMNFGQITLSFRGYEDAHKAFTEAVRLQPQSYDALMGLGAALRGKGLTDDAKVKYEAAIAVDGRRPEAYFNLGVLFQDFRAGTKADLDAATGYYREFLSRGRSNPKFASQVRDVERTCPTEQAGGRRRARRRRCMSGRLENIQTAIRIQAMQAQATAQPETPPAPTPASH